MKDRLKSINTLPFVICLAVLLLNDFYLKTSYPSWLTGKLSDFSGLYVFVSFFAALFPNRKQLVYLLCAFLFIVWKSPASQSFIDFFSQNFYPIQRVVDSTDLMALSILPLAYILNKNRKNGSSLNPIPLALVSIFAFCATSMPHPTQRFEQPQYILFKSGIVNFESTNAISQYEIYHVDSFLILDIERIGLGKRALLEDEFQKVQVLQNLDLYMLQEARGYNKAGSGVSDYEQLRDSLIVMERISITLKKDSLIDHLTFKNSRLDGPFQRFLGDKLVIQGFFKNGIEDSVWTFYDRKSEILTKKYFNKGELVKTESFENSILKSEDKLATRDETIRNKYFHLALVILLMIGLMCMLYSNFRKSHKNDSIQLSTFSKIAGSIALPGVILIVAKLISSVIPNSSPTFFLEIIGEFILAELIIAPLLLLIFYGLKLRSRFDLIYYILLLSLAAVFIEELVFLNAISK